MLLVLVFRIHRDRFDELRQRLRPVLLEEALTVDALGHADHGEWPVGKVRQHEAAHTRKVAQEVALGRRWAARPRRRPVDAVEVAQAYARTTHLEMDRFGWILELLQHFLDDLSLVVPCGHRTIACGVATAAAQRRRGARRGRTATRL